MLNLLHCSAMKLLISVLGILCALCHPLAAVAQQPAAHITITPQAIFARYVQALGGEQAVRQVHTAHLKMELYYEGRPIPSLWIERFEDESGKYYQEERTQITSWRHGFDGDKHWTAILHSGRLQPVHDPKGNQYVNAPHNLGIVKDLFSVYKTTEVLGATMVGNAKAVVVRGVHAGGSSDLYYFDAASGLLIRSDVPVRWYRMGATGEQIKGSNDGEWGFLDTCRFKKYEAEPQSRVLFPSEVECTAHGTSRVFHLTKVEVNTPIDPKLFQEPK